MRFRDRFARFMYGRYGIDDLGRFMLYLTLILMIFSTVFSWDVLFFVCLAFMILSYFRIFSKNIYKRGYENDKYLCIKGKIKTFFGKLFCGKNYGTDGYRSRCNCYKGAVYDAEYKVFKCPSCKQKLRVPRGKGRIQITCRRCGKEFIKKT